MGTELKSAKERFVESWGQMGGAWGINKTMARIHALLMISDEPLTSDDVMRDLAVSRGNASMNLRALVDWGLIRRVSLPRDRKEYFTSEKDVWTMCCRIARERKKREIEPVIGAIDACLKEAGSDKEGAAFRKKLNELLELVRLLDFVLGKVGNQEKAAVMPKLLSLLKAVA
jgi:DNA-binding transcriptional regulator GbsR (MarR family)